MTMPVPVNRFRAAKSHLKGLIALCCGALALQPVLAEDLNDVFRLAVNKDADIRQARAQYDATHMQLTQGRSYLLPQLSATANMSRNNTGKSSIYPTEIPGQYVTTDILNSQSYGFNLSQALINFNAWYTYKSAKLNDEAATLRLAQNEQDLIVRVAKAYFNVLRGQANLASSEAEEAYTKQFLEQLKQKFDVGLATLTDVYGAQANYDITVVSKLRAINQLNQAKEALEAIVGQPLGDLNSLNPNFPISPMTPANMQDWVKQALEQNLAIRISSLDRDAKEQDAKASKSANYPTVDLRMNYQWSKNDIPNTLGKATDGISLNFSLPLFSGGRDMARTRQAEFNLVASMEGLSKSQRDNIQNTRNAYRGVDTDVKAVSAYTQAIQSAQSQLEFNEIGAEVGTRNIVDVVQAQQLLFRNQRDYANARFDYVIDTLTLKQVAGVLSPQDLIDLNQWLHP